jgi:hypothetical protein
MADLASNLAQFLEATADPRGEAPRLQALWSTLAKLIKGLPPPELDELLRALTKGLAAPHPQVAGLVALLGGCIVEEGGSPRLWAEALLPLTAQLLPAAQRAIAQASELPESSSTDLGEGVWVDGRQLSSDDYQALVERDPIGAQAFRALDHLTQPLIAALTRSPRLLKSAAVEALRPELDGLHEVSEFTGFLYELLRVPIEEQWLIIDPKGGRGFELSVTGVANAFQVYALVHAALLGAPRSLSHWRKPLPGPPPAEHILAVARGTGPQETQDIYVPPFTLFRWSAVTKQRAVPNAEDGHEWYSMSAIPAELARFEGQRVAVLGDFNVRMDMNVTRTFGALAADMRLLSELDGRRVARLLQAFATSAHPGHPVPLVGWP